MGSEEAGFAREVEAAAPKGLEKWMCVTPVGSQEPPMCTGSREMMNFVVNTDFSINQGFRGSRSSESLHSRQLKERNLKLGLIGSLLSS